MLKPSMIHLQLTRKCNLRCPFCHQNHTDNESLSTEKFLALLDEIHVYSPGCTVFFWGGEALIHPDFATIANYAKSLGLALELITNGTLLDRHIETVRNCFQRIFISIDGPENIHDAIRGKGVFARVAANLQQLTGTPVEKVMMSVMTMDNMTYFQKLPFGLPVDRAILHRLIDLAPDEADAVGTPEFIRALRANYHPDYSAVLKHTLEKLRQCRFSLPVEFQPHFPGQYKCLQPEKHLHVAVDGNCTFCTDYPCFPLGNVKEQSLMEIFTGDAANRFRSAPEKWCCRHCSWKNRENTIIRFPMD